MSKIIKWIHKLIPKSILPTSGEISLGMVRFEKEDQSNKEGTTGTSNLNQSTTDMKTMSQNYGDSAGTESAGGGENRSNMLATPYALSAFYGWDYSACLSVGTNINMADGSTKLIEDLEEGDEILSAILPGLETVYSEYRIYTLDEVKVSSTKIEQVVFDFSNHYYIINDKLKGTKHPTMAFRNNYYEWWEINHLKIGDGLVTTDLSLDNVISIERVDEEIEIVGLRVENNNTCFAEGYLVHD